MSDLTQRVTELEELTDAMVRSQRSLLTAQIIINDRLGTVEHNLNKLVKTVDRLAEKVGSLADTQKHFDERVDKLVVSIGELIQRLPPVNGKQANGGSQS